MFELVPGVINVFAVYIVVNVLCNFSDVGFDFLSISFGEDISLLWLLFTVVWFNNGDGDDDIVVRDSRCISRRLISDGLFVNTRSNMFPSLVDLSCIWVSPYSDVMSNSACCTSRSEAPVLISIFTQSRSGQL